MSENTSPEENASKQTPESVEAYEPLIPAQNPAQGAQPDKPDPVDLFLATPPKSFWNT